MRHRVRIFLVWLTTIPGLLTHTGCDQSAAPPDNTSFGEVVQSEASATNPFSEELLPDDDRLLDKTFDDIKFDIEPDAAFDRSMLTKEIEALDQRRMRIRGYILPSAQKRLKQFVLVRDNQECCFGPGAALYDCILVEMQPGETANYTIRPVAVEGRFVIEEFENPLNPKGPPLAIYRIEGEVVR